jgi:hypothetical protein
MKGQKEKNELVSRRRVLTGSAMLLAEGSRGSLSPLTEMVVL